jgi:hypothetical protein
MTAGPSVPKKYLPEVAPVPKKPTQWILNPEYQKPLFIRRVPDDDD